MAHRRSIAVVVLLVLVVAASSFMGCSSIGLARLPSNDKLFISTSTENGFVLGGQLDYPYQPLGFVKVQTVKFTPCFMFTPHMLNPLANAYVALEETLNEELASKASSDYGADGIIQLDWLVAPGFITTVRASGLAIKKKQN